MEEAYCLVSLGTHYGSTLGDHAERKEEEREERSGRRCSGLLTFNDCLWMTGSNKHGYSAYVRSACPASLLTKRKTSVSTGCR